MLWASLLSHCCVCVRACVCLCIHCTCISLCCAHICTAYFKSTMPIGMQNNDLHQIDSEHFKNVNNKIPIGNSARTTHNMCESVWVSEFVSVDFILGNLAYSPSCGWRVNVLAHAHFKHIHVEPILLPWSVCVCVLTMLRSFISKLQLDKPLTLLAETKETAVRSFLLHLPSHLFLRMFFFLFNLTIIIGFLWQVVSLLVCYKKSSNGIKCVAITLF